MRFLITAIGSMSAMCAIKRLKADGHFVVGCDIYPGEWHYETKLCDLFYQAPFATQTDEYINFLIHTCTSNSLNYIIPLTDIEIDVINANRVFFEEKGITLCMPSSDVLKIARNKYQLFKTFVEDPLVPSIKTFLIDEIPDDFIYPCIAKPFNGRSSEGLLRNASHEQILAIPNKENYIVQEQLQGDIFTVDFCRSSLTGHNVSIPRVELLRTKNGAGLTVQIIDEPTLIRLASHIGNMININGCVNFEFIKHDTDYYLIDVNPRFSAGIAFSYLAGYDMVLNHIRCFTNCRIDDQIPITNQILIKRFEEAAV